MSEAVRVATGQAVAPPVGGKQDPEALVAAEADAAPRSAASASGPTAAAASTAPVLDEGAAAKAATIGGNTAASSRGASAERGPGRPSAAPPRPPVPGRVPAPDRAVQALAAGSARLQEETLAFARAQIEDLARTGQALATCTSLSAAMTLQIQAASRQFARYVAHGQTLASIGREMWQSLGRPDPDKGR